MASATQAMKRLLDIILSALLLFLLIPVFLILAILVRLSSPGPSLFRQTRVGLGGKEFLLLKFRTMSMREGAGSGSFDAGDDSRVTGIGKLLRATKLDELPQFWNVLKGDMSLVGPRPEVRKWVEAFPERWERIHQVKPGITDPAAIIYRNEEMLLAEADDPQECYRLNVLPRKLDLYDEYVRNHSLWLDIKIIAQTMVVLLGKSRSH